MRIITLAGLATLLALLSFSGCGRTKVGEVPLLKKKMSVSGTVSKGPVRNGTVRIYSVAADGTEGPLLKETQTDSDGRFEAEFSAANGPVLIEGSGSYFDEATGRSMTIARDAPLRAVCSSVADSARIAVTPLTELAASLAGGFTQDAIDASNKRVSALFGFDVLDVQPVDPVVSKLSDAAVAQDQVDYSLVLAVISQMGNGAPVKNIIESLSSELGAGNSLSPATINAFQNAASAFLDPGNTLNQTGISDIRATNLKRVGTLPARVRLIVHSPSGGELLSGAELTLLLPEGAAIKHNITTGATPDGVVAPGASAPQGALITAKYSYETSALKLALISSAPFGEGEFVVVAVDVPADKAYGAGDFGLSGIKFVGENGAVLDGLSASAAVEPL